MDATLRQQLHTAISIAEAARADMDMAAREYERARDTVNELIDKLAPLDQPNGATIYAPLAPTVMNKIALIKMIRDAATEHARDMVSADRQASAAQRAEGSSFWPLSLKTAKDLVETWIEKELDSQRRRG